jgi:hypothetical protein
MNRRTLSAVAAVASLAALPLVLDAVRRAHPGNYTRSPEFRSLVAGYII